MKLILFLIGFFLTPTIKGQECQKISYSDDAKDALPNILKLTLEASSYVMMVEANLGEKQKSLYAMEYYDITLGRGRTDTTVDGTEDTFLYFDLEDESFWIQNKTNCVSSKLSENPKSPADTYVYGWSNKVKGQPIYGASNLLRDAYVAYQEKKVGKEKDQQEVRGVKTSVWRLCLNNDQLTVRLFFIDQFVSNGFGVKHPVPTRITVKGLTEKGDVIDHVYDVINFQEFVSDPEAVFQIPPSVGCERQVDDIKQVPNYEGKDFHVEGEVVYTSLSTDDTNTYVSNMELTMDAQSQHIAYTKSTWKTPKPGEKSVTQSSSTYNVIYDLRNGIRYVIPKDTDDCFIYEDKNFAPVIEFPDGQRLELDHDLLITNQSSVNTFHYLGEGRERGIPVSIYEKVAVKLDDMTERVITRYHLSDDTFLDTEYQEKDAPIKIKYWAITDPKDTASFFGETVFNFYGFSSQATNRRQRFDVTSCFSKNDESEWFQIIFPMRENSPDDVIPVLPKIENNIVEALNLQVKSPLRFPKVTADVDADNLYVSVLILERPNFLMDFVPQGRYSIKDKSLSKGITSLERCARYCLEREKCQYFSYCGSICVLADDNPMGTGTEQDDSCFIYNHAKHETSLPTINEISRDIALKVDLGDLVISVDNTQIKKNMIFKATGFKEGIAFGINGLQHRRDDNIEEQFNVYKEGYEFDAVSSDEVQPFGVQSYASCRRSCLVNPRCESLSFCVANSQCSQSQLHGDLIKPEHVKPNAQCSILTRTYSDSFDHFPGFSMAAKDAKILDLETSELCAKACLQEKSFRCLSFDFCYQQNQGRCHLNKKHFSSLSPEKKIETFTPCGHYSLKLVYDFKPKKGVWVDETVPDTVVRNATEDECARYCLDQTKYNCKTFQTCYTSSSVIETDCYLFSKSEGELKVANKPTCTVHHLTRSASQPVSVQVSRGYSRGTVGGVGFFVFLIGIAIGAGTLFAYGYYKANRKV